MALPALVATALWVALAVVTPQQRFLGIGAPIERPNIQSKVHVLSDPLVRRGWSTALDIGMPTDAVGFQWSGRVAGSIEVRALRSTGWTEWMEVEFSPAQGPDPTSKEARQTSGAGPVWVGRDATRVEVRVLDGELKNLRLHAIRSPRAKGGEAGQPSAAASMPPIISRAAWGADESFRNVNPGCANPEYASSVRYAVLHHTATGNDYASADAAAVVRSIYYFHTHTNGWCDIAYNFLVDRYGQIFEGRAGGVTQAVVGAHAQNYNNGSTGVAMVGTFQSTPVPGATYNSLRSLLAWKMSIHRINPTGTVTVNGRVIPTLVGHRDVNSTDCPGNMGYSILPQLRNDLARDVQLPPRVGVINACGGGYVKEGPLNTPFIQQLRCGDARSVQVSSSRVGVINGCGAGYVKPDALSGPFHVQTGCNDTRSIAVSPSRVAVITGCAAAYVKEGALSTPFHLQMGCGDAAQISLTDNRFGVISGCGAGSVKEGSLGSRWSLLTGCGDTRQLVVSPNRVAVINGCGASYVKEGSLGGPFQIQTGCNDARSISVTDDRVAVVNGCGAMYVKEGSLANPFRQQTGCNDAQVPALGTNRIGVINGCGAAYVKEGALTSGFAIQLNCGDARALSLSNS